MSDVCREIKWTAMHAADVKLGLYGGSDEYEQAHIRAVEIIYGKRDRELRTDVDEEDRAFEEIAAWATTDAKKIAGGWATKVDRGFAKRQALAYAQHLQHPGCRNAILTVRDLDDFGRPLNPQQEERMNGAMREHPNHPAYLAARFKPGKTKSNTTILVTDGVQTVDRSDVGFGPVPMPPEAAIDLLMRGQVYVSVILGDYDPPVAYRVEWMEPHAILFPAHPTLFTLGFRLLFQSRSRSTKLLEKRDGVYGMGPRKNLLGDLAGDSGKFLALQPFFSRSIMREKRKKAHRESDRAIFIYRTGEKNDWSYVNMHLEEPPYSLISGE